MALISDQVYHVLIRNIKSLSEKNLTDEESIMYASFMCGQIMGSITNVIPIDNLKYVH